ncbi:MAG: hypothetical protein R2705_11555 [Ilumatobacteraceae bacterium]
MSNGTGTTDPMERFETCVSLDVGGLSSVGEVERWVREVSSCRAVLEVRLAELAARADQLGAAPDGSASGGVGREVLRRGARVSGAQATAESGRARVVELLPEFGQAWEHGQIVGEHIDALARVLRDLPTAKVPEFAAEAAALVDTARRSSPERLAREARSLANRVCPSTAETEAARLQGERGMRFIRHRDGTLSAVVRFGNEGSEAKRIVEHEASRVLAAHERQAEPEPVTHEQANLDALMSLIRASTPTATAIGR